jgi:hypothetical protein
MDPGKAGRVLHWRPKVMIAEGLWKIFGPQISSGRN